LPDGAILESVVDGESIRTLAAVLFVQAIDHGAEHRTHIRTCLTQQGIEPPDSTAGDGARRRHRVADRGRHLSVVRARTTPSGRVDS
jgi:hypothetical protein